MKDGIILFLKENIIGRNLFTEDVVYKLENGKLEGVYSDRMIFSDLMQTENGFKFNMTTITHELIYNVDNKDNRTTVAKDYTGTSVGIFDVNFDGKELKWQENQLLYRDSPIGDGNYKPAAFDAKVRFHLDKGKAVFEYLPTLWDVNPDTLVKSLSKDDYPVYISKER